MARQPGRPPNPTKIDEATMVAVRRALLVLGREFALPSGRYSDPSNPKRTTLQPDPLELAALAIEARDALELIAAEHVERARALDGLTWAQVGERFGTSMQSAHSRFRRSS